MRDVSPAVGVMVVWFILEDEMRAQNDEQTNYYAKATRQVKTTKQKTKTKLRTIL